ncbi:MAG: single-stranded DNA-binding protein, partial [Acidimicrobiales bacterium]
MNVVVLRGKLSRAPEERELGSGTRLVRYEVTIRGGDGPAETSPVAWLDPPAAAVNFEAGEEVVVVGRVRRRWFRRGAVTESRVEVAADAVI